MWAGSSKGGDNLIQFISLRFKCKWCATRSSFLRKSNFEADVLGEEFTVLINVLIINYWNTDNFFTTLLLLLKECSFVQKQRQLFRREQNYDLIVNVHPLHFLLLIIHFYFSVCKVTTYLILNIFNDRLSPRVLEWVKSAPTYPTEWKLFFIIRRPKIWILPSKVHIEECQVWNWFATQNRRVDWE